jgi:hypothetical protein
MVVVVVVRQWQRQVVKVVTYVTVRFCNTDTHTDTDTDVEAVDCNLVDCGGGGGANVGTALTL